MTAGTDAAPALEPRLEAALDRRRRWLSTAAASGGSVEPPEITARLRAFLGDRTDGVVEDVHRLAGGGTNVLFGFTLRSSDGSHPLVLRTKPNSSGVTTDVVREAQLMAAVQGVVPAPRVWWVTEDPTDFGSPALICDLVPGRQRPSGAPPSTSGMGAGFSPRLRTELGRQFVTAAADLHRIAPASVDLGGFVVPAPGTTEAIDAQLAFWDRVWAEDRIEHHPTMALTRDWLWRHRPPLDHVSLLHGDLRSGNFLFDEDEARITGFLDWELGSLGDRHRDLAYSMMRSFGEVNEQGRFLVGGLLTEESFVDEYTRRSGLPVDPERLRYYAVFNMYWTNISMLATALRSADTGRSQLDVMYQLMAGHAVRSCVSLDRIVGERR